MRISRWVVILLITVVSALVVLSAVRTWREHVAVTGLTLRSSDFGVEVGSVLEGGPAEAVGLRAGDRILQIAGHPVAGKLVAEDLLSRALPGRTLGITVYSDGQRRSVQIHTGVVAVWQTPRIVASFVALSFLLGAIAVLLRPRRSGAEGIYLAWCLCGALVLGISWSSRADLLDWLFFWLDRGARLVFPALYLHLVLRLGSWRRALQRWTPLVYAPVVGLLLVEIHMIGFGGALRLADPVAGVDLLQSRVETFWIALGWIGGVSALVASYPSKSSVLARARFRWVLAGTVVGIVPFLALSVLPQWAWGKELSFAWLALPFLSLVPLTFTQAVLDYRVMDLALFGRRTLSFSTAMVLSGALFLGIWNVTEILLSRIMTPTGLAPMLIAALITAALGPAIRAGSRDLAGRIYYRRRYNFRRALQRVARDLNAERDLPRLTASLEARVGEALDVSPIWLLLITEGRQLKDPLGRLDIDKEVPEQVVARLGLGQIVTLSDVPDAPRSMPCMHRRGIQVLVPQRMEDRLISVLAVGVPRSGSLLDSDDLDLLRTVSAHAAAAIAGALHLEELREQVDLIRRLQSRSESLIDSSPVGMVVVDRLGYLRHWNPAIESLLGIPRAVANGRHFTDVLPSGLHSIVRHSLLRFLGGSPVADDENRRGLQAVESPASHLESVDGQERALRLRLALPSGGERVVNLVATRLSGTDETAGVLLSLDDVTQRLEMEEKMIQQDRLASVGLLAAGVAHEVNTPLTGISSYAQMLLGETADDDPRRALLEKIVKQSHRASTIAQGLLHISRPGNNGGLRIGPVDVREVVEETVSLLGPHLRRRHAVLETRFEGRLPTVAGDRPKIQQVVMNLILNAIDALEQHGTIVVVARRTRAGDVLLEVIDDGHGIPAEIRDRIFDPFFTTKSTSQGTGLGLSISYAIVREHRGTLTVKSSPNEGTTMRLVLPSAGAAFRSERARGTGLRAG